VGYNLSEHQLISIVRRFRSTEPVSQNLNPDVLFSILQVHNLDPRVEL
jgi:hypothetical protein